MDFENKLFEKLEKVHSEILVIRDKVADVSSQTAVQDEQIRTIKEGLSEGRSKAIEDRDALKRDHQEVREAISKLYKKLDNKAEESNCVERQQKLEKVISKHSRAIYLIILLLATGGGAATTEPGKNILRKLFSIVGF